MLSPRELSKLGVEVWKPVNGFESQYAVSNLGRVKSFFAKRSDRLGRVRTYPEQIIGSTKTGNRGYPFIVLVGNGVRTTVKKHHLVIREFEGEKPFPTAIVRHLNDDRNDTRLCNLEYGSHSQNKHDALNNGKLFRGSKRHNAKLTENDVVSIKLAIRSGERVVRLAEKYGVGAPTIQQIKDGRAWKHVLLSDTQIVHTKHTTAAATVTPRRKLKLVRKAKP